MSGSSRWPCQSFVTSSASTSQARPGAAWKPGPIWWGGVRGSKGTIGQRWSLPCKIYLYQVHVSLSLALSLSPYDVCRLCMVFKYSLYARASRWSTAEQRESFEVRRCTTLKLKRDNSSSQCNYSYGYMVRETKRTTIIITRRRPSQNYRRTPMAALVHL